MTEWNRTAGDEGDTITPTLNGVDLVASPPSAQEAHVWRGSTSVTLTATVASAAAGTLTVELDGWLDELTITSAQAWSVEYQLDWPDGSSLTWPEGTPDRINVRPQAPAPTP